MADIERAEKWAREYAQTKDLSDFGPGIEEALTSAYLAGSAQTQYDYAGYLACPRCECTCGAR